MKKNKIFCAFALVRFDTKSFSLRCFKYVILPKVFICQVCGTVKSVSIIFLFKVQNQE
jgi:hypothetical protein